MTCDNGKEFALFATIEQFLGIAAFFANPLTPSGCCTSELNPPLECG